MLENVEYFFATNFLHKASNIPRSLFLVKKYVAYSTSTYSSVRDIDIDTNRSYTRVVKTNFDQVQHAIDHQVIYLW